MPKSNHCGDCVAHGSANPQKFPQGRLAAKRKIQEELRRQRQLKRKEAQKGPLYPPDHLGAK